MLIVLPLSYSLNFFLSQQELKAFLNAKKNWKSCINKPFFLPFANIQIESFRQSISGMTNAFSIPFLLFRTKSQTHDYVIRFSTFARHSSYAEFLLHASCQLFFCRFSQFFISILIVHSLIFWSHYASPLNPLLYLIKKRREVNEYIHTHTHTDFDVHKKERNENSMNILNKTFSL